MLKRIKNYALYADTDEASFNSIRERMQHYNCFIALCFASAATALITIMFLLSFIVEGFAATRPVYIYGLILSVIQILIALCGKKHPLLSYISVYMAISVFMIYGIAIGTVTRPEEQTVTFMVLLVFVPLLFVDRPINIAVSLIFYIILFIIMACKTKTGTILTVDIIDAIIFGILSIISETVANRAKIKGYVLERWLRIMSETDQMTGLRNRNSYEMRLPLYNTLYQQSICCIYMDVNGLHELNNSQGHKAGDDMLCFIANTALRQFGPHDLYRIGGDEYVAFVMDAPVDSIISDIKTIRDTITEKGYFTSIGYAFHEGKDVDINKLIIDAETRMYKDKAEFYEKNNLNPR